ncbi:MAG: HI0074 family nucleotidyltransferase substrate-binding subunit [Candidatus Babeliales bacterium]|jgi:nucleotidyltransferase substrate binding protein (TIGR01987 family)
MGKLDLAKENLVLALERLSDAIEHLEKVRAMSAQQVSIVMDKDELERSLRDSLIQRFEFCIDLFWKLLKKYEEEILNLVPETDAPRPVIVTACKARIISEADAETLLEMIKSRNFTSHIYKEEIADRISSQIPAYYTLMRKYSTVLKSK